MATVASYLRPTVSWQGRCTVLRKNPLPQSLPPPPPPPPRIIVCFTSVRLLVSSSSSYDWYLEVCDKEIVERQWWHGRQQLRWGRQSGGRKKNMRVWSGNGSSEDAGGGGGRRDALGVEERVGEKEVLGFDISRLEAYSERAPSEVLRVHAMVDDEEDQGFSSSLTRATAYDPAEPVLPSTATVQSIDRIRGPYNPSKLRFIKKGLSWEEFQEILKEQGI
ncbi:hypothetical protein CY35_16G078000 [Sphagnum magellanicum]|nr:hypothetical protein CY35_16G078000 [Sphagnum magellanicum]